MILELFIKRPVVSLAITIALILFGVLGYLQLPVREFPVVGDTLLSIETNYPGASQKVMRDYVSTPITTAVAGLEGIDYIASTNSPGQSVITIKLEEGQDPDEALTQINTQVSGVLWKLPKGVLSPVVQKNLTTTPCIFFNFSSGTLPPAVICDYIDRVVAPQFQSVEGVRTMLFHGHQELAMRLWLNPRKMAAFNLSPAEVARAVEEQSVRPAAGRLQSGLLEFNAHADTELTTPEEFDDLVISSGPGRLVRLSDVGYAELGPRENRTRILKEGKNAIVMGVVPRDHADSVEVAQRIRELLPNIKKNLPPNLSLTTPWTPSEISRQAVNTVFVTAGLAVLCVLIVIFLFLGDLRGLTIPVATIPCSILGVCGLMHLLGHSVNTLTLLGGVLAIGLVVDDAIVVLENSHRHMEKGLAPTDAALAGIREIWLPVVAMTLTVAVVFLPIAFMSGLTGALFHQFALTVAATVLFSGLFALVLSPMMCAQILRPIQPNTLAAKIDGLMEKISRAYGNALEKALKARLLIYLLVAAILAGGWFLYSSTQQELMPDENQGVILAVGIGPASANIQYAEKYAARIDEILSKVPERQGHAAIMGWPGQPDRITGFLVMRKHQKGDRSQNQLMKDLNRELSQIPGIHAFAFNRPPLMDVMGVTNPVTFVLKTSGGMDVLAPAMDHLMDRARSHPGLVDVRTDLKTEKPGVFFSLDREKAGKLGITAKDLAHALNLCMGRPILGWFSQNGRSYPVVPQVEPVFRDNPRQLDNIRVRAASGALVPLSNLVTWQEQTEAQTLDQFQQMNSATLTAHLAHGTTLGQALDYLNQVVEEELPGTVHADYMGQSREFTRAGAQMKILFAFSLVAIYLMLAAQFNSLADPLVIMTSVPLSLFGALVAMKLTGATLNIYTQIGLVMLIGLISKHGILIVNFANKRLEEGIAPTQAVLEAARIRLRPVLMTTFAMVFGALPLALATGTGHQSLNQIGAVIIGGLSFGTLLTLFVLPAIYLLAARPGKKVEKED